jgi:hypothetical protein
VRFPGGAVISRPGGCTACDRSAAGRLATVLPAPPGRGRRIGIRESPREGRSNELPAGVLSAREMVIFSRKDTRLHTVGWDWGGQAHSVTVLDEHGTKAARWMLPHTEAGITGTLRRLSTYGDASQLPVAIETSKGLVVDRLLAAGHPVVAIHPGAFNAMRPRWGASRAKTDNADSFMLADLLRTDGQRLKVLAPTETATLDLQALSRQRSDLVATRTSLTNQLRALLEAHCWKRTGRAQPACSRTSKPRSHSRSWTGSPPRTPPPSSPPPSWTPSCAGMPTPAARAALNYSTASRQHPGRPAGSARRSSPP